MRKLLKYEMRAMNRRLLPLYGGMIAIAILNYFFGLRPIIASSDHAIASMPDSAAHVVQLTQNIISGALTVLMIGLFVAIWVIWLLTVLNRFRRGLLGEEGYLMFTLPVSTEKLVGSKMIASSLHLILSGIVSTLAIIILAGPELFREVFRLDWTELFRMLTQYFPSWPLAAVEAVILTLLGVLTGVLQFYTAMSIGQLSNSHRTLFSVLAYIGICFAQSTATQVLGVLGVNLLDTDAILNFIQNSPAATAHIFLLGSMVYTLILGLILWFANVYILKKHLNLE